MVVKLLSFFSNVLFSILIFLKYLFGLCVRSYQHRRHSSFVNLVFSLGSCYKRKRKSISSLLCSIIAVDLHLIKCKLVR